MFNIFLYIYIHNMYCILPCDPISQFVVPDVDHAGPTLINIWDNKFFGVVGGWCIADWPRYGQTGSGKTYTMRLLAWSGSNAGGCRLIVWIQPLLSHLPSSPWHCKIPASTCQKMSRSYSPIELTFLLTSLITPDRLLPCRGSIYEQAADDIFSGIGGQTVTVTQAEKGKQMEQGMHLQILADTTTMQLWTTLWQIVRFAITGPA